MKIEFTVDGKQYLLNVNSNKPLNLILFEDIGLSQMRVYCGNGSCGNCIVLLNSEAVLSCLTPAFRLKGAKVETFEGYQKSRFWQDIERAYKDTGSRPCPYCFSSKTLIFESLLQAMFKTEGEPLDSEKVDPEVIVQEISLNKCPCLDASEMINIFTVAANYRRRRRVRRY